MQCSRSIEKWFKRPTPHDYRNQFKRVVQNEDIGDGAGDDPASVCVPKIVGGDGRRASRRFLDGEADDDKIAEGLDHGQAGAGERAIRQPHAVVAFSKSLGGPPLVAIRYARGGRRVNDRVEVWDRSQCDTDRARMHMEEVGSELGVTQRACASAAPTTPGAGWSKDDIAVTPWRPLSKVLQAVS